MGDDIEDMPIEEYRPEKRYDKKDGRYGKFDGNKDRGKDDRFRGDGRRDKKDGRYRDDSKFKKDNNDRNFKKDNNDRNTKKDDSDRKFKKDDNKERKEKYDIRSDGSLVIKQKKFGKKKDSKVSFTEYAKNKKLKD